MVSRYFYAVGSHCLMHTMPYNPAHYNQNVIYKLNKQINYFSLRGQENASDSYLIILPVKDRRYLVQGDSFLCRNTTG